jgi:hypothetical protein
MNKLNIILLILIGVLSFFVFLKLSPEKKTYAIIDGQKFYVDVAKTDSQKEKGLSIYKNIEENQGMIFPFSKTDYYTFWMKDMKFPIDIIYIRNNAIVDIFKDAQPPKSPNDFLPTYTTKSQADTVLEINAGLSQKYKFKIGNRVIIKY